MNDRRMWRLKFALILWSLVNFSFVETKYCDICGKVPANYRVANGAQAKHAPWAVYIKVQDVKSADVCTGVLIHYQWVLTAGHCVEDLAHMTHHQQSFSVQLFFGAIDMRNLKNGKQVPAVGVYLHQSYSNIDPANPINDIALIELANAIPESEYPKISPICLGKDAEPDDIVTIEGYGMTDCDVNPHVRSAAPASGGRNSSNEYRTLEPHILRQGTQVVRPKSWCLKMYERKKKIITDQMVCSKSYKDKPVLSCIGDSGGAVWMMRPLEGRHDKRAVLVGLVSFGGPGEGVKEAPDISTRVKSFLPWIQATSKNEVKPCWEF